jgi:hypothetical protein
MEYDVDEGEGDGTGLASGDYQNDFSTNSKLSTSYSKKATTRLDKRVKANKKMPLFLEDDEHTSNYSGEYRIKRRILRYYDKMTRPVTNDTTVTSVVVGMSLFHILDTVRAADLTILDTTVTADLFCTS